MVTMGGDLQPVRLADQLVAGLCQPELCLPTRVTREKRPQSRHLTASPFINAHEITKEKREQTWGLEHLNKEKSAQATGCVHSGKRKEKERKVYAGHRPRAFRKGPLTSKLARASPEVPQN
eukprot:1143424-Pelagomonas_calceolata.AAC.2